MNSPKKLTDSSDRRFMKSALALARRGLGTVAPNPSVGCVIVTPEGRMIGRGWTQPGGRPHAETEALAQAGQAAHGATAYVTLEPCSHTGQTPPCCEALINAGIARVVVAIEDPDERVSGRGIAILEDAGIAVSLGVMSEEASAQSWVSAPSSRGTATCYSKVCDNTRRKDCRSQRRKPLDYWAGGATSSASHADEARRDRHRDRYRTPRRPGAHLSFARSGDL